jgi:hypothetical protein
MRVIRKEFKTLKQAERYQNQLYNRFESVQLVGFPRFSEDGIYTWNVKE